MRAVLFGLVGAVLAVGSAGANPLAGEYRGRGNNPHSGLSWQLYAKVTSVAPGKYKINLQSTNATCASMVDGAGALSNRTLKVSGDCDLTIISSGKTLRVKESPSCAPMHGAACSYDGTLRKTTRG